MLARDSIRYVLVALVPSVLLLLLALGLGGGWWIAFGAYLPALAFVLFFFRDPHREAGPGVVSPADGRVLGIEATPHGDKLSIFMTPLSVHVNRAPLAGRVARTEYRQGAHVPAFKKESEKNERFDLELEHPRGPVRIALIAGTVARRIHPYVEPGHQVNKGERIGLIAFGSRCELVLPRGSHRWTVAVGDWVKAGQTTVAEEG